MKHSHAFKFGKTPARAGAIKLKFASYVDRSGLPKLPAGDFGHGEVIGSKAWGMLGNDKYGCCVWAGAAHETMQWCREAGSPAPVFTENTVTSDYAAVTGFKASDPSTDQGTDMALAAKYRRDTGILDASGKRHKIDAFLELRPGHLEEHWMAMYLFGAIGIGIEVPACFMDQFDAGKPWDISTAPGAGQIEGGHYIPGNGRRHGNLSIVTYGQDIGMTPRAFAKYNDESVVYLSAEALKNRRSPEGFDYDTLLADLRKVTA